MQTRREFLQRAALLSGSLGTLSTIPTSILRAMNIEPAESSTFMDAEHVVLLMQENRSFDHAYGALRGVRGFDDPRAIELPGGNPVWLQTDAEGNIFAPFGLNIHETKATWMSDLPHDRDSQVAAGNNGKHDQWLKEKQSHRKDYAEMPLTLGYYDRNDIPFYYAFADAFTICDQHFCSAQTCTTPNRLFHWTGTNRDPRNPSSVARLSNGQIDHDSHADWITFPERLEEQGISWRIYQNEIDLNTGIDDADAGWLCNFGDNPMEYFDQYQVGLHPARMEFVAKRVVELKQLLSEPVTPSESPEEEKKIQKRLAKLQKELANLEEEQQRCTPEAFAALSARERNLLQRAFTTNTNAPNQRKVEILSYRDGDEQREVKVPAGDVLHQFREDVNQGKLPTVSWLVAPANFSDHPSTPWYGAWYISEVLDILTRNPEVWKKTIFILTYDENDGYFDHVPPFVPPHTDQAETGAASRGINTVLEFDEKGHPLGLGYRVPMVIASPWTRGGCVCSEVFDHTSVLQFLEVLLRNKGKNEIKETNISTWRRTICGNLTSAFKAAPAKNDPYPDPIERNPFVEGIHKAKFKDLPTFRSFQASEIASIRRDPTTSPLLAKQEKGSRPSCALPYELKAEGRLNRDTGTFEVIFEASDKSFGNRSIGAPFHVYAPGNYGPDDRTTYTDAPPPLEEMRRWSYAVAAGDQVPYSWKINAFEHGRYHLRTYGPNGFYREYQGDLNDPQLEIDFVQETNTGGMPTGNVILKLTNQDRSTPLEVTVRDNSYGAHPTKRNLTRGESASILLDLKQSHHWYDFSLEVQGSPTFARRYAGRIETGELGQSDPAIGRGLSPTANR